MLAPQFIIVDDELVSRSNYIRNIYRQIDKIKEKSENSARPRAIKPILLDCVRHDLWEVCYFLIQETPLSIYRSWFDDLEKKAWDMPDPRISYDGKKKRSRFYFALLELAQTSSVDIKDHLEKESAGKPADFWRTYAKSIFGEDLSSPDIYDR
ncbi:hypothetical protein [Variovorax sp. RA8]|uniref:hypothetical protein n=1 Tax=Variovorax sp. (strain JCM 16519 / RA8) TaxID=662548 RepID=UPI000AD73647|nr:hypothetical protein [Variovorax sp. RA8]